MYVYIYSDIFIINNPICHQLLREMCSNKEDDTGRATDKDTGGRERRSVLKVEGILQGLLGKGTVEKPADFSVFHQKWPTPTPGRAAVTAGRLPSHTTSDDSSI